MSIIPESVGFYSLVEKASLFASAAHAAVGQVRKYTSEPYINHPRAVAELVDEAGGTAEMVAAAWLHDVVEDTKVTIVDIHDTFGDIVSQYVYWLTDNNETKGLNRAARKDLTRRKLESAPPEVKTIKLADLIDNTQSIVARDPDFARVYMVEKKELIWALKEGNHELLCRAMQLIQDYEQGRLDAGLKAGVPHQTLVLDGNIQEVGGHPHWGLMQNTTWET